MTENELRVRVKALLPDDGGYQFRTFAIPPKAQYYDVGSGAVPLRCKFGDIRGGVAVFEDGNPYMAWALEVDGRLPDIEIVENLGDTLKVAVENLVAAASGHSMPHGVERPTHGSLF